MKRAALTPDEIDVLIYSSALDSGHVRPSAAPTGGVLDRFCYRGSWLQDRLALDCATVSGVAQQGCAGMFSSLRQARALLLAEPDLRHILCVGADVFDPGDHRDVLYNVLSDAACATVVSRKKVWARWLAYAQITKGYYWDVAARETELIAAYFPSARAAMLEAIARAGLKTNEIDLVIPTGVNPESWPILLGLCGLPASVLYHPRRSFGHTVAADSFIHLTEARESGHLHPGQRVLLFTYGFGSSWCALVLEITEEVAK